MPWDFSERDAKDLRSIWARLQQCTRQGGVYSVGGGSIRYHLGALGMTTGRPAMHNFDFAVRNPRTVYPNLCKQGFIVAHYEALEEGQRYWAVADEETGRRINIFPARHCNSPRLVDMGGWLLPVQGLGDQFIATLEDICKILDHVPVDPKQFADLVSLLIAVERVYGPTGAPQIWLARHPHYPLAELLDDINEELNQHRRKVVRQQPYRLNQIVSLLIPCRRCIRDAQHFRPTLHKAAITLLRHRK